MTESASTRRSADTTLVSADSNVSSLGAFQTDRSRSASRHLSAVCSRPGQLRHAYPREPLERYSSSLAVCGRHRLQCFEEVNSQGRRLGCTYGSWRRPRFFNSNCHRIWPSSLTRFPRRQATLQLKSHREAWDSESSASMPAARKTSRPTAAPKSSSTTPKAKSKRK